MNTRFSTISIVATIAIVATLLIGLVLFWPFYATSLIGLFFILLAEAIFFIGLQSVNKIIAGTESLFLRSGLITVLVLYLVGSVALSLVFIVSLPFAAPYYLAYQIAIAAVAAILAVAIVSISKHVFISSHKTMATETELFNLVNRLSLLAVNEKAADYKDLLNKLSEDLRFTDFSCLVNVDNQIDYSISTLEVLFSKENVDTAAIDAEYAKLNSLIQQRRIETASLKRGAI